MVNENLAIIQKKKKTFIASSKLPSLPLLVLSWYHQNLYYRIIKLSKVSATGRIQYGRCILSISFKSSCTFQAESNRCIAMNVHNPGGCGFSSDGISHQQKQDSDGFWGAWKMIAIVLVAVVGHNSMYLLPEEEQCEALVYVFRCLRIYLWLLTIAKSMHPPILAYTSD